MLERLIQGLGRFFRRGDSRSYRPLQFWLSQQRMVVRREGDLVRLTLEQEFLLTPRMARALLIVLEEGASVNEVLYRVSTSRPVIGMEHVKRELMQALERRDD